MQLPRRVPWSSLAELDQLCSYIYPQDVDDTSRNIAIERVCIAPECNSLLSLTQRISSLRGDS